MRDQAQELRDMGISSGIVSMPDKFPIGVEWKKPPAIKNWPKYKEEGVCVFTGDVEIVDVDSKHWKEDGDFSSIFMQWVSGFAWADKLICYKTINNGLQYPYRCDKVEGNQKLATRLTGKEAIIETRGTGGLAVCPPTKGYEWLDGGEWEALPTLTPSERDEFIEACRDFNQGVSIEISDEVREYKENSGKPGDDWAMKNEFIKFIEDHGWEVDKVVGEVVLLRRPGKKTGASASWNFGGLKRLFVWTSSTDLPTEKMLKPFAVKAYLEHGGDFKACAIALRDQGYGNDALALVEACSECKNWGEVGLILQENKNKIEGLDSNSWNDFSFGLQALGIKGLTENKLDKHRKGVLAKVESDDWKDLLTEDEDGKVKGKIYNINNILKNDELYRGIFFFDDFAQRIVIKNKKTGEVIDFDDTYRAMLRVRLGDDYGAFRAEDINDVVVAIAKHNHFHPLQEKILSLKWDGKKRVDNWLIKYCGATDSPYNRIVGKKWMLSSMARLFKPGCKVDNIMILEGPQGAKKSSLLRLLSYDNFLDGSLDIRSKDGQMALFGKWIVEFSELEGMNGRTAEQMKAFLSKQDDKIRPPYGRSEQYYKRTCVFAGTTNKSHYLNDSSGNRRFWPVEIKEAHLERIEQDRDQLWAEVHKMFELGEVWWIDEGSEESDLFKIEQNERIDHSDIEEKIEDYLKEVALPDGRVLVKLHQIWTSCLGGKLSQIDRKKEHDIAECLRHIGLKKGSTTIKGVRFKGWVGTLGSDS